MEIAYSRSSIGYLLGEVQIWMRQYFQLALQLSQLYSLCHACFFGAQNTLLIYIIYSGSGSQSRVWTAY